MLQITIPQREYFDDSTQEFVYTKGFTLNLEHSLISISKWESKWKKPFLNSKDRTYEESLDYVRCMSLNSNIDDESLKQLRKEDFDKITAYIDDKCTATWFNEDNIGKGQGRSRGNRGQTITSELIYYWMITYEIPFECQKWHLNRLLTLIRICDVKNTPSKKMKKKDIRASNRALNEARKAKMGTRG